MRWIPVTWWVEGLRREEGRRDVVRVLPPLQLGVFLRTGLWVPVYPHGESLQADAVWPGVAPPNGAGLA